MGWFHRVTRTVFLEVWFYISIITINSTELPKSGALEDKNAPAIIIVTRDKCNPINNSRRRVLHDREVALLSCFVLSE